MKINQRDYTIEFQIAKKKLCKMPHFDDYNGTYRINASGTNKEGSV